MSKNASIRISLTRLLSRIQDKSILLENGQSPKFNILSHPLLNPYPKWVGESKSWGIFGTFSDYVIRKILLNLFPKKIKLYHILAEHSRDILINSIEDIQTSIKTPLTNQLTQDYKLTDLIGFYEGTGFYIKNYKNKSKGWKKSLYEIFRLSHLDRLYRENKLILPQTSKASVQECIPFFKRIEQWLKFKFKDSEEIYLNPPLGHKQTLNADADLVIDSGLYEIKTVLYPQKYIEDDFHQLYGYVALFEYLKRHEHIRNYQILERPKIDTIGFIFPLFLQEITMDISEWKINQRLEYLKRLLSFKSEFKK